MLRGGTHLEADNSIGRNDRRRTTKCHRLIKLEIEEFGRVRLVLRVIFDPGAIGHERIKPIYTTAKGIGHVEVSCG